MLVWNFIKSPFSTPWRHVTAITALLVMVTAAGGLLMGSNAVRLFDEMSATWERFDSVSEQKITYLTQIHRYLGFTGFSMHTKNYLLYGDDDDLMWIDIDLDQAKNAVDSYRLLSDLSPEENEALHNLGLVIKRFRTNIELIAALQAQGLTPVEIDKKVDLTPGMAANALDQLRWAWRQQADKAEVLMHSSSQKGQDLIAIGWVFIPVMAGLGLLVFSLVKKLTRQVSAYEREKAALEESERRFRDLAANVPGVIFQWIERRSGERGYLYVSPRCQEIYGVSPEELKRNWQALALHPDDEERYLDTVKNAFEKRSEWSFEGRFLMPSGEEKWWRGISKPVAINDEDIVFNGVIIDISLQKQLEQELRQLATTDSLTGAANRRQFVEAATSELERAERYKQPISFLMLDLDHFKKVNDTYGHAGGDEVLRQFVKVVRTRLRGPDVLGRVGGEEFAIMLPQTDTEGAKHLAERIRLDTESLAMTWEHRTMKVTVSIGVASRHAFDKDIDAVLARADAGLYAAKENGRNQVMVRNEPQQVAQGQTAKDVDVDTAEPGPHGAN
ncbi:diguanylate cyclase [Magnetovibrio sp. PR-2]|uniref:diguanylate cyclase n=1 Tax=Magnetovibrio sp. PR-2 TaxID=3120356 RepID=UPI002FCDF29D